MCRHDCLYTPHAGIRRLLIEAAELDTRRYFRRPGEIVLNGKEVHRSELDWLLGFQYDLLHDIVIARFFTIYRLHCLLKFRQFNRLHVVLCEWVQETHPISLNDRLEQMQESMFFPNNELSAVSKLSVFANPRCQVFIWDTNARRAIDHRYPLRQAPRRSGYAVNELPHFSENAPRCLSDELGRSDFVHALNAVILLLIPVRNSVFGGDNVAIRQFAARRLLDKLMHCEGRLLLNYAADPCGEAAQQAVQDWIDGLKGDISAADEANRQPDAAD